MPTPQIKSDVEKIYEQPQTGDQIVFNLGIAPFKRTLIIRDDRICCEEHGELQYTLEEFRSLLIEKYDFIIGARISPR
jgi:hypothetical protein